MGAPGRHRVAGILLTGGASRRLGRDKATVPVGGTGCAERVAAALAQVAPGALEVGPGVSGLRSVPDAHPGLGPLGAILTGWAQLCAEGGRRAVLALACDMPLVTPALLGFLARWPDAGSVVPVVEGRPQPLCARYSPSALDAARLAFENGARSMEPLRSFGDVRLLDERAWATVVAPQAFADVDTPADLAAAEAALR
jgi:molybdopterin-guanine dinucleotide biosynthesis protein A